MHSCRICNVEFCLDHIIVSVSIFFQPQCFLLPPSAVVPHPAHPDYPSMAVWKQCSELNGKNRKKTKWLACSRLSRKSTFGQLQAERLNFNDAGWWVESFPGDASEPSLVGQTSEGLSPPISPSLSRAEVVPSILSPDLVVKGRQLWPRAAWCGGEDLPPAFVSVFTTEISAQCVFAPLRTETARQRSDKLWGSAQCWCSSSAVPKLFRSCTPSTCWPSYCTSHTPPNKKRPFTGSWRCPV